MTIYIQCSFFLSATTNFRRDIDRIVGRYGVIHVREANERVPGYDRKKKKRNEAVSLHHVSIYRLPSSKR